MTAEEIRAMAVAARPQRRDQIAWRDGFLAGLEEARTIVAAVTPSRPAAVMSAPFFVGVDACEAEIGVLIAEAEKAVLP